MSSRVWLACVMAGLVVGCSTNLSNKGSGSAEPSTALFAASPTSAAAAERLEKMESGTDVPAVNALETGRHRGIAKANCGSEDGLVAGYGDALKELRIKAANGGADYLRIRGTGPIESRGFCDEGYYRLDGTGYRIAAQANSGDKPASVTNADTLTERLEELEVLRERGLITNDEYVQLRQRVISEAY